MRKITLNYLQITFLLSLIFLLTAYISPYDNKENDLIPINNEKTVIKDTVYLDTDTVYCFINIDDNLDWNKFIQSVIYVESKGNVNAVGTKDDVGILQIRQTVVDDCNRIVGYEKYSLDDRTDSLLSIEMFNVIQNYYNPKKDFHYALKIWNPQSSFNYHYKIAKQYNKLVN